MKPNEELYQTIMKDEGLSLSPYLCPAGIPTIGYGNTFYPSGKKVTMQDAPISLATAKWMLKETVNKFALDVDKLIKSNINQNQFNALVSFAFNVGIGALGKSSLLRKVNINPNDPTIALEFSKWNKAGGRVLTGLTKRRLKESKLYFS
jgi:lysozyme